MKQFVTTTASADGSYAFAGERKWHQRLFKLPSSWMISILIGTAILIYFPVFTHRFLLEWDDQWVVQNSYTDAGLSWSNWWSVLREYYSGQYAPVNETWYLLLHEGFGYNAFWFHTGSLLIHIINVILVYTFFLKLLTMAGTFSEMSVKRIAFITSFLLTIHPFVVESVAWLSASKIILYVMFYIIALKGYLQYVNTRKWGWYIYAIGSFILSFGAKEQAVTMPVCLLLIDYVLKRDFKSRRVWLEKLPFLILALFFGIVTILSQADISQGALAAGKGYPYYQRIIFASYCLTEYFVKAVLPVNLLYLYPFPNQIGDPVPWRFWMYPFVVVTVTVAFYSFWKQRWIFFAICFFALHLTTVLHIIPISRYAIIADRYVYLSAIGVWFMLAYLYDKFLIEKPMSGLLMSCMLVCYCFYLGAYANIRSKVWHNSATLKVEIYDIIKQRKDYRTPEEQRRWRLRHDK